MPANKQQLFDSTLYRSNLEIILKAAQEGYDQITFRRHAIQHSILRNYMWLATVLFGAQIYLFTHIAQSDFPVPWQLYANIPFYIFVFIALLLSGSAFAIGIYAMKGGLAHIPYGNYDNLFDLADKESRQATQPCRMQIEMINSLITAIQDQRKIALKKGKFIRLLPSLMLWSLFLSILALAGSSFNFPGSQPKKEVSIICPIQNLNPRTMELSHLKTIKFQEARRLCL